VAAVTTFTISTGTFTAVGPDTAVGNGTNAIVIQDADLASALTINDGLATGTSTNNVSFDTGTVTSATITLGLTAAGADTIAFNTYTANGAGGGFTNSGTGTLTTQGGAISVSAGTSGNITSEDATIGAAITVSGGAGGVSLSATNSVAVNAAVRVQTAGTG